MDIPSLGYAQPWVVSPGELVSLHASLPQGGLVDVVRIHCANAEVNADGSPYGPISRIVEVSSAALCALPAQPQSTLLGSRVEVQWNRVSQTPECMVFALHRQRTAAAGHVLSMHDDENNCFQVITQNSENADPVAQQLLIGWQRDTPRSANYLTTGDSQVALDFPANCWLLIKLSCDIDKQLPVNSKVVAYRVDIASCDAGLPGGIPLEWRSCGYLHMPALGQYTSLSLGTVNSQEVSADVRVDILSLLNPSWAHLSPTEIVINSTWEKLAQADQSARLLLRGQPGGKNIPVLDESGQANLRIHQRPYTAVRGIRWNGQSQNPAHEPTHYSALHLQSDMLLDAHWAVSHQWQIPQALDSGCYAFRIQDVDSSGSEPCYVSFFVSAAAQPRHRLAVLMPTFSYLAYANATEHMRGVNVTSAQRSSEILMDQLHPHLGQSLYETHPDKHSVLFSSSRRPMLSVTPTHRPWQFVADTWLLDWLDRNAYSYDLITDHDLHKNGAAALQPYQVILTGHHPEYTSTAMWDGLWRYLNLGGRLMYLGGNGFYWHTAYNESEDVIEVRRAEDGTRPSIAPPGEYHSALSGEYGGLWRRLGRAPQRLVGVGMAAQGFVRSTHYKKTAIASAVEWGFVFKGVESNSFGHQGLLGGGASGWEIDRADADLGTPASSWVLASSENHDASMLRTKEELLSFVQPFKDSKARSDMLMAAIGQGAVFSVGSMTWIGALHNIASDDASKTDVSIITSNILNKFLDPQALHFQSVSFKTR
jgi:hypothetical protein